MRILVLDDDYSYHDLFAELLEGHAVITTESIDVARRIRRVDLYLLDATIQEAGDGLALAEELAEQGHWVVIVSGVEQNTNLKVLQKTDFASISAFCENLDG